MSGHHQSFARTRTRLRMDFGRIAEAVKRPGVDPRTWLALARVDDDPDARVWDDELGWIVDVTFRGGALDGEGPIPCRVMGAAGAGAGVYRPPHLDALVVVAVPHGDPNNDCIVLGELHDVEHVPPAEVNGTQITEEFALATHILVYPGEDIDAQFRNVRLTGEQMVLGAAEADQPFARGADLADALDALADALDSFANALATAAPAPPNAALTVAAVLAAYTPLATAIGQFKTARDTYLSTRIRGD